MLLSKEDLADCESRIQTFLSRKWTRFSGNPEEFEDLKLEILSEFQLCNSNNERLDLESFVISRHRKYLRERNWNLRHRDYGRDPDEISSPEEIDRTLLAGKHDSVGLRLNNLWRRVPSLRPSQAEHIIFKEYVNYKDAHGTGRGFETNYAKTFHKSQPTVSETLKRAKSKYGLSLLLFPEKFNAKILFEEYGSDWIGHDLRERLWTLLKPGPLRNQALVSILMPYQNEIFKFGERVLTTFSKDTDQSPSLFYQGYHAVILGTYINPDDVNSFSTEILNRVVPKSWLAGRVVARQSHLLNNKDKWEEYRDWLLEIYASDNLLNEKMKYIGYMVGYFGGFDKHKTDNFVMSKAEYVPDAFDAGKIIKEHYKNVSEMLYRRSPVLMQINFLRLALVLSLYETYSFDPSLLSCIAQIIQQTRKSSDNTKMDSIIFDVERKLKRQY